MKKFQIILLFVLGIFFMPSEAFACGKESSKTKKSCCSKKKTDAESDKKSCCDKKDTSEKGCGGKCGQANCTSVSMTYFSVVTYNDIEIKSNLFVTADKKHFFCHNEANISNGFYSIWLIPKIS